jgi:hypothetical protein
MSVTSTVTTLNETLEQRAVKNVETASSVLTALTQRTCGAVAKLPVVGGLAGRLGDHAVKGVERQGSVAAKAVQAPYEQQAKVLAAVSRFGSRHDGPAVPGAEKA